MGDDVDIAPDAPAEGGNGGSGEPAVLRWLQYGAAAAVALAVIVSKGDEVYTKVFGDEGGGGGGTTTSQPVGTLSVSDEYVPNVSLAAYYDDYREQAPPAGLSAQELEANGVVYHVDALAEGVGGETCGVRVRLYDGLSKQLLGGPGTTRTEPLPVEGGACRAVGLPVWAPVPDGVDAMYLELRLVDAAGARISPVEHTEPLQLARDAGG